MKFPGSISKKIILSREEYNISSERYILNQIAEYMEPFGMMETRPNSNESFYLNTDVINSFKRRRLIRNVLFKVEITDTSLIIIIESSLIIFFVIFLLLTVVPPFFFSWTGSFILMTFGLCIYFYQYLMKSIVLDEIKKEVENYFLRFKEEIK